MDLVNLLALFLPQPTLLRCLIFLLGSLTVTLTAMFSWISFELSIDSTVAFPASRNSDHVSISIDCPLNSNGYFVFHGTAYNYFHVD